MVETKKLVTLILVVLSAMCVAAYFFIPEERTEEPSAVLVHERIAFHEGALLYGQEDGDVDPNWRDARRASFVEKLGLWSDPRVSIDEGEQDGEISEEVSEAEFDGETLPLGDGKISLQPQVGHIFSCTSSFGSGGALVAGPWISGDTWVPNDKVVVDGAVSWTSEVTITTPEGGRVIVSNGLPDHTTGIFPITPTDDAYQYDRNPNSIRPQAQTLQLPAFPTIAAQPSCLPMGIIGIGLNGVAIFNGLDAAGRDAAAHEIQDVCDGHPEQNGQYHYHNESECLVQNVYEGAVSTLVGYALDGFGIFASVENGVKITNEDLDACHGHTHSIPWNGELRTMYHYHMTDEYPYTLGCFMGTPVHTARNSMERGADPMPHTPPSPVGGPVPPLQQNLEQ